VRLAIAGMPLAPSIPMLSMPLRQGARQNAAAPAHVVGESRTRPRRACAPGDTRLAPPVKSIVYETRNSAITRQGTRGVHFRSLRTESQHTFVDFDTCESVGWFLNQEGVGPRPPICYMGHRDGRGCCTKDRERGCGRVGGRGHRAQRREMERRVDSKIIDKCGGSKQRDNALSLIITDSSQPDPLANTLKDLCPECRLLCRPEALNERIAILTLDYELASGNGGTRKIY
jgi:hypothetical protein